MLSSLRNDAERRDPPPASASITAMAMFRHLRQPPGGSGSYNFLFGRPLAQNLYLYTFQNPVCAGIMDRVALLSKGGWDAFSKTPAASNPVIGFWVELHLGPEPTRHSCADSHTAKGLPSPCGGTVGDGIAGETEMEKVTGIGGLFFRAHDPEALGRWYQQHLGISPIPSSYGNRVAARGRTHRFRSFRGDEQLFRRCQQGSGW